MPSMSEIAGRTRDRTMSWVSAMSRSDTTLNCMTGISVGLNRPTAGSSAPAGKTTSFTAALTWPSAAGISVPNLKVASTRELPSVVLDPMASRPSIPTRARSTGAVTSPKTASGPAAGYRMETVTSGNSISGKSSTLKDLYANTPANRRRKMASNVTVGLPTAAAVMNLIFASPSTRPTGRVPSVSEKRPVNPGRARRQSQL